MSKRNTRPTPIRQQKPREPEMHLLSLDLSTMVQQRFVAIEQAKKSATDFMEGVIASKGLDTKKNWRAEQRAENVWAIIEVLPEEPPVEHMPTPLNPPAIASTPAPVLPPSGEAQGGDMGDSLVNEMADPKWED